MRPGPGDAALRLALGLLACLAAVEKAQAQSQQLDQQSQQSLDQQPVVLQGDEAFALGLQLLVEAQDWAGALELLDARPDLASRPDAVRLRAELLRRLGREREAVALLESQLTREPDDALARLQLAEAHHAAGQDQAAALAYRMALSGQLDPLRVQLANGRLKELADRRRWRLWAGASLAPDSNINSATDAKRVDLFGLPFDLDESARRQSGVAFTAFGGVERRFLIADRLAIRADVAGALTDASGRQFDTWSMTARAGPEWRFGNSSFVSLQASGGGAWFAGDMLETRAGVLSRYEVSGGRTLWSGAAAVDKVDDRLNEARDGVAASADIVRTRYLSPASLWRATVSVARKDAAAAAESFTQVRTSAALLVPGPWSTMAYVEPYVLARTYDGAAAAFGEKREDFEAGLGVRLSKRDWVLLDAFPFLGLSVSRNESNIALNDYSRERIEFGFTREF